MLDEDEDRDEDEELDDELGLLLLDGGTLEPEGLELDSDGDELDELELDELDELELEELELEELELDELELDELDSDGGGVSQLQQLASNIGTKESVAPMYVPWYFSPTCSFSHSPTTNSGSPDKCWPA